VTEKRVNHRGSCLCGKVAYQVEGVHLSLGHCHCVDCRKAHGAAFSTNLEIRSAQLAFLKGGGGLRTYRSASGTRRAFCGTCGSTVACWGDGEADRAYVCAATLDTHFDGRTEYHIYVRSRAPWYEIRDRLPRFEENTDGPA